MTGPVLQLAANTCFGAKHWPDVSRWLPVVQAWQLEAVQFSLDLLDPLQPAALALAAETAAACAAAGVQIQSTFTGGQAYLSSMLLHPDARYRMHAKRWLKAAVRVTAAMGAMGTGGFVGATAADTAKRDQAAMIDEVVGFAGTLGSVARDAGLEYLLIEIMPGEAELPNSPTVARELIERINEASPLPYALCFDLGHTCAPSATDDGEVTTRIYRWLEQLLDLTRCVHLQQTDGHGDRHWPFTCAHAANGGVDPVEILKIIRRSPLPAVDLVLEIAHPPETAATQIAEEWAESVALWQTAIAAAGRGSV